MSNKEMSLLSRAEFRDSVFKRDKNKCVFCDKAAIDAHHIIERKLWNDGGYYLNNGASVCEEHHLACERTDISVEDVRIACNITKPIIPEHFYNDVVYDKWGNIIQSNGSRLRGELYNDESVQKIIKNHLDLFVDYVKYPRTYHLPYSNGINKDDKQLTIEKMLSLYSGKEIVITEKMDGENTSLYNDYTHARSIDSKNHLSRNWVKKFWNDNVSGNLPERWRICGENLYAKHSIGYDNLESYFYGFSIWNEKNFCLSWEETLEYFELLNIKPVKVLYQGIFDEKVIKEIINNMDTNKVEGFVLRLSSEFSYHEFKSSVAKFVRDNHIQTTQHWMHGQKVEPNQLIVK